MADLVLLTGASGHVGSRLLEILLSEGHRVRVLSRSGDGFDGRPVDVVEGDVTEPESLVPAFAGVRKAYYLVHGLADGGDFAATERAAAEAFGSAALAAGCERIVYLGGLARGEGLSEHLRSRQEVGEVLRTSGVLTVELRASIVIGDGSASFELVRTLVDNLPALLLPSWIDTGCQPIALDDVVAYLLAALDVEVPASAVFEIGGADRITYGRLLEEYARAMGLERRIATVPALVPLPSSADLPALLTRLVPERALIWGRLLEGVRFDSTVEDPA